MTPPSLEIPPYSSQSGSSEPSASAVTLAQPTHGPKNSRGKITQLGRALGWSLVFGTTAIASALGGALFATSVPLPEGMFHSAQKPLNLTELWQSGFRYRVTRSVNILVMGVDLPEPGQAQADTLFSGRADTILLVQVDPEGGGVNVLSIPRDTKVDIPGEGIAKINHANLAGGPELVAQTIQTNIGPVPIDRYVRVSTGALRELVNLLGGIDMMVPERMAYEDKTQGLVIDLNTGWQTLDGDQAEQFARFRADGNGDIGRVQRQQMLLKALRERLTHPTVIPRLPQAMRVMLRYVDTNLTVEEILALMNFATEIAPDDLHMVMLPGRFSTPEESIASYWIPELAASQQVVSQFFQLDEVALLSHSEASAEAQALTNLPIAIQNASGEPQIARSLTRYLQQEGFRNIYVVPDWPSEFQRTQVIAQRGDLESAAVITSLLGVGRVVSDSTGDLQSELTIRVGRDWTLLQTTVQ